VTGPPPGVSPARLFRLLLRRPRPEIPIAYRIRGAEDVPLRVRALSSADEAAVAEAAEGWGDAGPSRAADEFVFRALLTQDGPAFASPDEVGALDSTDALSLAKEVRAALDVISPNYARSDVEAWGRALKQGARAGGNWADAIALGGCVDYAFGYGVGRLVERPDRYFGCPLADLTDGQWMAYRAAREVAQEFSKK
jgi:hypothetical protein